MFNLSANFDYPDKILRHKFLMQKQSAIIAAISYQTKD